MIAGCRESILVPAGIVTVVSPSVHYWLDILQVTTNRSHIVLFFEYETEACNEDSFPSSILLGIQLWHVHSPQGSWGHFMGVPQIWGVLRSILRSIQAKLSIKRKRINSVFAGDKRAEFGWVWELIRVNVQPVSSMVWYLYYIRYLQCSWALHRCQHDLRDGYLQCIYGYMIFAHCNTLYMCMYIYIQYIHTIFYNMFLYVYICIYSNIIYYTLIYWSKTFRICRLKISSIYPYLSLLDQFGLQLIQQFLLSHWIHLQKPLLLSTLPGAGWRWRKIVGNGRFLWVPWIKGCRFDFLKTLHYHFKLKLFYGGCIQHWSLLKINGVGNLKLRLASCSTASIPSLDLLKMGSSERWYQSPGCVATKTGNVETRKVRKVRKVRSWTHGTCWSTEALRVRRHRGAVSGRGCLGWRCPFKTTSCQWNMTFIDTTRLFWCCLGVFFVSGCFTCRNLRSYDSYEYPMAAEKVQSAERLQGRRTRNNHGFPSPCQSLFQSISRTKQNLHRLLTTGFRLAFPVKNSWPHKIGKKSNPTPPWSFKTRDNCGKRPKRWGEHPTKASDKNLY